MTTHEVKCLQCELREAEEAKIREQLRQVELIEVIARRIAKEEIALLTQWKFYK